MSVYGRSAHWLGLVVVGCWAGASWARPPADEITRAMEAVKTSSSALAAPCRGPRSRVCAREGRVAVDGGDVAGGVPRLMGACYGGFGQACMWLADFTDGVEPTPRVARTFSREACDRGMPEGCALHAFLLEDAQGGPRDALGAIPYWRKGCEGKIGYACHDLGLTYAQGLTGPVDDVEAARLFILGCELDETICGDAGGRLIFGWGVKLDVARGEALLQRACKQGEGHACVVLAEHFRSRSPPDDAAAVRLDEIACLRGSASGCRALAEARASGIGVRRDLARAADEYRLAAKGYAAGCDQADGRSCAYLADLHAAGLGVARDLDRARALRARACQLDPRECPDRSDTRTPSSAPRP